jgi:hypothetical protein
MHWTELDGGVFSISHIRMVLPDFFTCGIRQVFPQVTPDCYVLQSVLIPILYAYTQVVVYMYQCNTQLQTPETKIIIVAYLRP